jgi:hypothetical protein
MLLLGNPRVVSQMPMFFVAYTFLVVMVVELLLLTAVVAAKQGPFVCFSTLDAAFFSHVDLDVTPGAPTSSIVTAMLVFSVLQHTGPIPDKPRQGCCSQKATKTTTTFILQHTSSAAKTRQKKKAMENQGERWHLSSNPHHHHHHQYMWACGITKIGSCRSWVPMHMYAAGGWFGRLVPGDVDTGWMERRQTPPCMHVGVQHVSSDFDTFVQAKAGKAALVVIVGLRGAFFL